MRVNFSLVDWDELLKISGYRDRMKRNCRPYSEPDRKKHENGLVISSMMGHSFVINNMFGA